MPQIKLNMMQAKYCHNDNNLEYLYCECNRFCMSKLQLIFTYLT